MSGEGQTDRSVGTIGLLHLVWVPLGPKPFAAFLNSYREQGCGIDHQLVIIFNGAADDEELEPFRALLSGVEHHAIRLSARTLDIPAYLEATRRLPFDYYCFVNSYSLIRDPQWLAKLHLHASRPGVGLVGASGSWESLYSTAADFILRGPSPRLRRPRSFLGWLRLQAERLSQARQRRGRFALFPNPHVRSNVWMIRRDILVRLEIGSITTKLDAHCFESGLDGLSNQLTGFGMKLLVVGRDGIGYAPEQWPESRTFRIAQQENLLVSDNRTDQYLSAEPRIQAHLREITWGRRWR